MSDLRKAAADALEAIDDLVTWRRLTLKEVIRRAEVLRAALAQEAEPVAELRADAKGGGYIFWMSDDYFEPGTKLYTAPPAAAPVAHPSPPCVSGRCPNKAACDEAQHCLYSAPAAVPVTEVDVAKAWVKGYDVAREEAYAVTGTMTDAGCAACYALGVEVDRVAMRAAIEAVLAAAWIPCAERMPDTADDYIVAHRLSGSTTAFWVSGSTTAFWDGDRWRDDLAWELEHDLITHWQPLPEPPTQDVPADWVAKG